jgi:mRNA interferase MazF
MASIDELWLVDFGEPFPGEPAQIRPALIVGPPESFGPDFPFVIVVPLTTRRRGLSLHIEIEAEDATGIDATSYAQCELIRAMSRRRLLHRVGGVDGRTSAAVSTVVRTLLDL